MQLSSAFTSILWPLQLLPLQLSPLFLLKLSLLLLQNAGATAVKLTTVVVVAVADVVATQLLPLT